MPRADDLCNIAVGSHPVPTKLNPLGVKGAGEAGTVGAMPVVMSAIIDALAPLGVRAFDMPATPERVLARDPGRPGTALISRLSLRHPSTRRVQSFASVGDERREFVGRFRSRDFRSFARERLADLRQRKHFRRFLIQPLHDLARRARGTKKPYQNEIS